MSGVIHVKKSGQWEALNFNGNVLSVKDTTWKVPTTAYVKTGGAWVQVYPSTSTSTSAANAAGVKNVESSSEEPHIISSSLDTVVWQGTSNTEGEAITWSQFGWSPLSTQAGFDYGAIKKVIVTFNAQADPTYGSTYIRVRLIDDDSANYKEIGPLINSWVGYTMDYTPSQWGISDKQAGALHLRRDPVKVTAKYNNGSSSSIMTYINTFRVQLEYYHN